MVAMDFRVDTVLVTGVESAEELRPVGMFKRQHNSIDIILDEYVLDSREAT